MYSLFSYTVSPEYVYSAVLCQVNNRVRGVARVLKTSGLTSTPQQIIVCTLSGSERSIGKHMVVIKTF